MKRKITVLAAGIMAVLIMLGFAGCGNSEGAGKSGSDVSKIVGDYYIDLTDLGMKLTIYLRIGDDGSFLFSNTTAFEVNKSAGTIQKTDDEYLMVYSSVNGEEKSISEGITSKFVAAEDGSLDFTVCEKIYYGSASATTTSADSPDAKLIAYLVPDDYEEESQESEFSVGTYAASYTSDNGTDYTYNISFYEDNSYITFITYNESGKTCFAAETGRYGVSTTQLALTPQSGDRVSCVVISNSKLSVSVPPVDNSDERNVIEFTKSDEDAKFIKSFKSSGSVLNVYSDGSFEATTNGFTEKGMLSLDTESGVFKPYPDNPTTGVRGLSQVATVPSGTLSYENGGKITLTDFRIRTSDSLNREKCTFIED
ncbi:MAG: hypothetical protein K2N83_03685 [Eubacterium sp.]|nr:hypothetical protein [Eubacterium sp.]